MNATIRTLTIAMALALAIGSGPAFAGRGGFRGGGFGGGFRGGSYGGFRGGGFGGERGGFGAPSFNRSPSFGMGQSYGGAGRFGEGGGANPYAAHGLSTRGGEFSSGPYGGHYGSGYGGGSFETARGGEINYGAAGRGAVGPDGGAAGRGVYGISGTTAGGRSFADVGRAGGVVGPNGGAIGGRSNLGAVSGPNGAAVGGSRMSFAAGPGGAAVAGRSWGGAYAGYHSNWVHGYWGGHYGGWGWGGYGNGWGLGAGWGLAAWGLGSALYSGWGYMPYVNPYDDAGVAATAYDYAQPIDASSAPPDDSVAGPALTAFDSARDAFKAGDYAKALDLADQAVKAMPNDPAIHEFRAVALFALGRYDDAAGALYGVLSVGPGWDWTTLISLYPDVDTYTAQLRALESAVLASPDDAAPRFVLADLYLTGGQNAEAEFQLRKVVALQPKDRVSAQLLQSLTKDQPAPDAPAAPATPASDPGGKVEGTWAASPAAGTTITLNVADDGKFTWTVAAQGKSHQLAGRSTSEGGILTLVPTGGGSPMVGQCRRQDGDHFTFNALGGGPGDPGLAFARSSQ